VADHEPGGLELAHAVDDGGRLTAAGLSELCLAARALLGSGTDVRPRQRRAAEMAARPAGADTENGGTGNDVLNGDAGNDTLRPGVERGRLLDLGRLRERTLSYADLVTADGLAVVSSLRDWRSAVLIEAPAGSAPRRPES